MNIIVSTPDTLGGKPRIAGHRISVQDVVIWHEQMGLSAATIAEKYGLTLADIQAALTYYAAHTAEIDQTMQDGAAFVAGLRGMV